MTVAIALFARRYRYSVLEITDLVALCGAPGLFFGRLGNFINGELYGRPTNVRWAMIFPADPLQVPRHPSQLYEAFAEGVILSALLWWIDGVARRRGYARSGLMTGLFLIGYAIVRFSLEFARQPDAQLGLLMGGLSMGQLLSMIMLTVGLLLLALIYRSRIASSRLEGRQD
jgi:phosphatidylglycerol:prolipoprotein diacylglycerol transferase